MPTALRKGASPDFYSLYRMLNQRPSSDLHLGNMIFANMTTLHNRIETDLMTSLGKPGVGEAISTSGHSLTQQVSRYVVSATSLPSPAREGMSGLLKVFNFAEVF